MRSLFGGYPHFNNVVVAANLIGNTTNYARTGAYLDVAPNTLSGTGTTKLGSNGLYFPGVDRSSTVYIDSSYAIGSFRTNDFTIELEFKIDAGASAPLSRAALISGPESGSAFYLSLYGSTIGSTGIRFGPGVSLSDKINYTTAIPQNVWHKIKIYRTGGNIYLILNNVLVFKGADTTDYSSGGNYPVVIGGLVALAGQFDDFFVGYMKNLRITKNLALIDNNVTSYAPMPIHGVPAALRPRVFINTDETIRPPIQSRISKIDTTTESINWSNPLTRGLVACVVPNHGDRFYLRDIVSGKFFATGNASYFSTTITRTKSPLFRGEALDLGGLLTHTTLKAPIASAVNSTPMSQVMVAQATDAASRGFFTSYNGNNALGWRWNGNKQAVEYVGTSAINGTRTFGTSIWKTFGFTFNKPNVALYDDGLLDTTGTLNYTFSDGAPRLLGFGGGDYFSWGKFALWLYWNRELTPDEMRAVTRDPSQIFARPTSLPIPLPSAAARPPVVARRTDGGDPYFNNVVLQLPLRNHARDESKVPKTITLNGDTKLINDALYLDGSGDSFITASASADYNPSLKFTLEFWSYLTSFASGPYLCHWYQASNARMSLNADSSGQLQTWVQGGGVSEGSTNWGVYLTLNKWQHIVFQHIGSNVYQIFIDGVLRKTQTINNGTPNITPQLAFGSATFTAANFVSGYYRGIRYTSRMARYSSELIPPTSLSIHGVPASNSNITFTYRTIVQPETGKIVLYLDSSVQSSKNYLFDKYSYKLQKDKYWSNVKLYLKLEDNFNDSSSNNVTVTDTNTVNILNVSPPNFYDSYRSAHFIAANEEYLSLPYTTMNSSGELTTFTIECWCYANGSPTVYPTASPYRWDLMGQPGTGGSTDQFIAFNNNNAFQYYRGAVINNGELSVISPNNSAFPNRWYYFVLQADGTNWKIFIDGVERVKVASTTGWYNTGQPINIGRNYVAAYPTWASRWNGYISNFRITNVARYSRNFTPPLLQFPTRS
jgi:hypothetical protein